MRPAVPQSPLAWNCPACRYEMTGVPGPICPECGIDALAEHERLRNLRSGNITPDWLLFPIAFLMFIATVAAIGSDQYEPEAPALFFGIGWLISLRWTWHMRRAVFVHGRMWRLVVHVVLIVVGASLALTPYRSSWHCNSILCFVFFLIAWMATALLWLLTRGREFWRLLIVTGFTVLAPGAALTAASTIALAAGRHWSPFSDPRPGQVHEQYPLTWNEVILFAAALALAGAFIVGASERNRRIARHDKAA